jgi:serine/threonine-protein kinase
VFLATGLAATLHELGQVYRQQGDYGRAEAGAREALNLRRLLPGADHPDVGKTTHVLGDIAVLRGQLADAEALYKQALPLEGYETLREKCGEGSENALDAPSGLEALYAAWGKPDKAAEWRKKLGPSKN